MLYDDRGTPAQRLAREIALTLMESAVLASALAAASTSGTVAYRRVPARYGHHIRLATGMVAAFASGTLIDSLLDSATTRARRRLNGTSHTDSTPVELPAGTRTRIAAQEEASSPAQNDAAADAPRELSDAEVIEHLKHIVASDAAHRAATDGWCHALPHDNFLTARDRWQGHPDGTASLRLIDGCTLYYEPRSPAATYPGDWRRATFVLDDNGTRTEVATPAELLAYLNGPVCLCSPEANDPYDDMDPDPDAVA
ncbi:hypothetical protein [Streptomyces parvus]|uniref:hypothetical protein n=1 Tax=Streptomyces parvus TaxID=66428 RepID=UPI002100D7A2|nr:hypothetical protein [Streptomyces parvus]MCQ1580416.1 hypothetical protein [Streptomyces parvus]